MELRHHPLALRTRTNARVAGHGRTALASVGGAHRHHDLARVGDSSDDFNWFLFGGAILGGLAGWFWGPKLVSGTSWNETGTMAHVGGAVTGAFAGGFMGFIGWTMYESAIHSSPPSGKS